MLEPDRIRAIGDRLSILELAGVRRLSFGSRGEGRRDWVVCVGGWPVVPCLSLRSGKAVFSVGSSAGNLKL
jgi:hypothetical protein